MSFTMIDLQLLFEASFFLLSLSPRLDLSHLRSAVNIFCSGWTLQSANLRSRRRLQLAQVDNLARKLSSPCLLDGHEDLATSARTQFTIRDVVLFFEVLC